MCLCNCYAKNGELRAERGTEGRGSPFFVFKLGEFLYKIFHHSDTVSGGGPHERRGEVSGNNPIHSNLSDFNRKNHEVD